jgi:isochorismate synthase EntC
MSFLSLLNHTDFIHSGTLITLEGRKMLIGYGPREWIKTSQEADQQRPAFYFPDFFLKTPAPWFQHPYWLEIEIDRQPKIEYPSLPPCLQWQEPTDTAFYQAFVDLQKCFFEGTLKKAVPYTFMQSFNQMTKSHLQNALMHAFNYLLRHSGYLYGFWSEREGMLGLTPELLFQYEFGKEGCLKTMALAGTSPKQENMELFKKDPKQLQEHLFVVEGIKHSLESFGTFHIGELQILELPKLNHLMTPIEVQIKEDIDFDSVVKALHPTPALGAFPRQVGWDWLKQYENKMPRGRFGAPVGAVHFQHRYAQCLVAIRNVQWNQTGLRIGAGCGIVKDSQYELEWKEVKLKLSAIREGLGL